MSAADVRPQSDKSDLQVRRARADRKFPAWPFVRRPAGRCDVLEKFFERFRRAICIDVGLAPQTASNAAAPSLTIFRSGFVGLVSCTDASASSRSTSADCMAQLKSTSNLGMRALKFDKPRRQPKCSQPFRHRESYFARHCGTRAIARPYQAERCGLHLAGRIEDFARPRRSCARRRRGG